MASDRRAVLVHHTSAAGCGSPPAWTTIIEIPDTCTEDIQANGDLARLHAGGRDPAGRLAAADQVPRLRLVVAALRRRRCATRSRPRWRRPSWPAGTGWCASSANCSTSTGTRPTSRSRATTRCSRPCGSGMFHVLQAGPRGERQADPGQGPDRPRLRRAHLLGHRDLRAAGADLHRAAGGPRRAALAALHPGPGPGAGPRAGHAGRGVPVADDQRRGVARGTGRPARRPSTSTPTSPTPSSATSTPPLDDDFDRDFGAELLIETARLWASLGHFDPEHGFRIDGVTGPDEYTAVVDNNVYTNLMAQRNLREAAEAVRAAARRRRPAAGRRQDEVEAWLRAAALMAVPYDTQRGVHMQSDAFTHHEEWDFEGTPPEKYPLLLHYPYFEIYRKQVVKQADLVMALHLRGDAFTLEEKVAQLRLLRGADDAGLVAVGDPAGGRRGRDRAPGAGLRLLGRGGADRSAEPAPQLRARAAHRLAGRAAGRSPSPASAACATTTAS